MDYTNDPRVVMTLDAGGTNFVFSAMQHGKAITEPFTLPAVSDNLNGCLSQLVAGFTHVKELCPAEPSAISFAFPGPADYPAGIIGDLPNFAAFRGGIPLGPYLADQFGIPVFINNDGGLFAYGEAMAGGLQVVNRKARAAGGVEFQNLVGITFGTGFGCGIVVKGDLLIGDNAQGGNIWCFRNKKYPNLIAEESVAIRAVQRVYHEHCDDSRDLTPKDISDIARGLADGNREAALRSFAELGEVAGDAIATAVDLVDGIVVIGGGLARSADLIFPSLVSEMNSTLEMKGGRIVSRIPSKVYNLEDADEAKAFLEGGTKDVTVPGSGRVVKYKAVTKIGVMTSKLGTSNAIALGAYSYALSHLG